MAYKCIEFSKTLFRLPLSFHSGNCSSLFVSFETLKTFSYITLHHASQLPFCELPVFQAWSPALTLEPNPSYKPLLPAWDGGETQAHHLDASSRLWTGSESNKELRNFEGQNPHSSGSRGDDSSDSCGNTLAGLFLHKYVAVFPASWLPSELPCFLAFPMSLSCSHWLYELLAFPQHGDTASVNSIVPLSKIGVQLSFGCFLNTHFSIFLT